MDRKPLAMAAERAAQLIDRVLGRSVLFEVAARRVRRIGYVELSSGDRQRLRNEPVIEVSVHHDRIALRPVLPELSAPRHVSEIGSFCENLMWRVTNTYLTDILDRPISEPRGVYNTVEHFACPVELGREGQRYRQGWDALATNIGDSPVPMSLEDFESASHSAITSTLSPAEARQYLRYYWA